MQSFGIYFGLFVVVTFVWFIGWAVLMNAAGFLKKNQPKSKDAIAICTFCLCPLMAFFALAKYQIYPPRPFEKSTPPQPSTTQKQVESVDNMGKELIAAFAKPEQLTLQQLRDLVDRVRIYANEATVLNGVQEAQITRLRQSVEEESKKAEEAQTLARNIRSLTSEQLDAVKFLITKDASEQSKHSFIYGVIVSFPVGIITSVLAAALWERIARRGSQVLHRIESAVGRD